MLFLPSAITAFGTSTSRTLVCALEQYFSFFTFFLFMSCLHVHLKFVLFFWWIYCVFYFYYKIFVGHRVFCLCFRVGIHSIWGCTVLCPFLYLALLEDFYNNDSLLDTFKLKKELFRSVFWYLYLLFPYFLCKT